MKDKAKGYLINFGVTMGIWAAFNTVIIVVKKVGGVIKKKVAPFFKETPEDQYSDIFEE